MTLAILSALADEQRGLIEQLHQPQRTLHAGREFWQGQLHGHPVVLALSKIGKVAAATTATALIEKFGVQRIVFTGVAGGIGPGVQVGDLVVARELVQHDLDASPLFPRFEVPLYGQSRFTTDLPLTAQLLQASHAALGALGHAGTVHHGLLASGDQFVSCPLACQVLRDALASAGHDALAVEMEGAAVAQVCFDYRVPFAAVRTISDRADAQAHVDFQVFARDVAGRYACAVIVELLKTLSIQ